MSTAAAGARLLEGLPRRPLVLHFDLNRTIIQMDLAGGKTLKDVLNNNLGSYVRGISDTAPAPEAPVPAPQAKWQAVTDPDGRRLEGVTAEQLAEAEQSQRLLTYDAFVDQVVAPKPKEMATLPKDEALELWRTVTAKRHALKNNFTEAGHPGAAFHEPFFTDMEKRMLVNPDGAGKETHFVIPSFFALLETLWEMKWPFRVVFRTFGSEIKEVLCDVAKVLGEKQPGLWGYVMRNSSTEKTGDGFPWCPVSTLYRDLKVGTVVSHSADFWPNSLDEWTAAGHKYEPSTLEGMYAEFTSGNNNNNNNNGAAMMLSFRGFVDHYPWWAANGEQDTAGKVFPVRVTPFVDESDQIQVFFDDNIYIGDPAGHSIVDLRNVATHEHISDVATQRAFLVQAEPRFAILDDFYYVRKFAEAAALQCKLRSAE